MANTALCIASYADAL